jgi:hypothetical protein
MKFFSITDKIFVISILPIGTKLEERSTIQLIGFSNFHKCRQAKKAVGHPVLINSLIGKRVSNDDVCPVLPPWDPGFGKKSRSGSGFRIRDEHPGSFFRELRNIFWV